MLDLKTIVCFCIRYYYLTYRDERRGSKAWNALPIGPSGFMLGCVKLGKIWKKKGSVYWIHPILNWFKQLHRIFVWVPKILITYSIIVNKVNKGSNCHPRWYHRHDSIIDFEYILGHPTFHSLLLMLDMAEFLASRRRRISSDRSRKEQGRGKEKRNTYGKEKKGNLKHKGEKGAGGQLLSSSLVTFFFLSFFPVCMQDMVVRKVANCNYY